MKLPLQAVRSLFKAKQKEKFLIFLLISYSNNKKFS